MLIYDTPWYDIPTPSSVVVHIRVVEFQSSESEVELARISWVPSRSCEHINVESPMLRNMIIHVALSVKSETTIGEYRPVPPASSNPKWIRKLEVAVGQNVETCLISVVKISHAKRPESFHKGQIVVGKVENGSITEHTILFHHQVIQVAFAKLFIHHGYTACSRQPNIIHPS